MKYSDSIKKENSDGGQKEVIRIENGLTKK